MKHCICCHLSGHENVRVSKSIGCSEGRLELCESHFKSARCDGASFVRKFGYLEDLLVKSNKLNGVAE